MKLLIEASENDKAYLLQAGFTQIEKVKELKSDSFCDYCKFINCQGYEDSSFCRKFQGKTVYEGG